MMERIPKRDSRNDEIRSFSMFEYPDGIEREVVTTNIGKLDEIKRQVYGEGTDPFPRVGRLLEAFENSKIAGKMSAHATERRPHLLIAGGFVRDVLTRKRPKDIDFVSNATYPEMYELLVEEFKNEIHDGKLDFDEVGKQFGVIRFTFFHDGDNPPEHYEIASFRKESEYDDGRRPNAITHEKRPGLDVLRRDITANALLYNPRTGTVVDYVGGLKDIEEKKLRFVGEPKDRIAEDKLRALRYIRFLFKTGFEEDAMAKETIKSLAHEIVRTVPSERISQELNAMFYYHPYGNVADRLEQYGLLAELLPEISKLKDCEQGPPYHMEGNVYEHTLAVMNNLPPNSSLELVYAAMMHDMEKPATRATRPDPELGERVSFHGHEEKGAEMSKDILGNIERFQNSKHFVDSVGWLIENHLRIFGFCDMSESKARKLASHPLFPLLMDLGLADARAAKPHPAMTASAHGGERADELFERINARYKDIRRFEEKNVTVLDDVKKATNGHEVMKMFEMIHGTKLRGKSVGLIKSLAEEEVSDRRITEATEARAVLEKIVREYTP